jgi:hypothetical protein
LGAFYIGFGGLDGELIGFGFDAEEFGASFDEVTIFEIGIFKDTSNTRTDFNFRAAFEGGREVLENDDIAPDGMGDGDGKRLRSGGLRLFAAGRRECEEEKKSEVFHGGIL